MPIYCLVDESRDALKIGFSKDESSVKKRVKSLQTASPFRISVYGIRLDLGRSDEAIIHRKLRRFKTGGGREWFTYSKSIEIVSEWFGNPEKQSDKDHQDVEKQVCFEVCGITGSTIEHELWTAGRECVPEPSHERLGNTYLSLYLENTTFKNAKSITESECVAEFLRCNSYGELERKVACCIASRLFSTVIDEEGFDEHEPTIFINEIAQVLFLLEGPHDVLMQEAEEVYADLFWDIDAYGNQLFCGVINSSRETKYVPYGYGWKN